MGQQLCPHVMGQVKVMLASFMLNNMVWAMFSKNSWARQMSGSIQGCQISQWWKYKYSYITHKQVAKQAQSGNNPSISHPLHLLSGPEISTLRPDFGPLSPFRPQFNHGQKKKRTWRLFDVFDRLGLNGNTKNWWPFKRFLQVLQI